MVLTSLIDKLNVLNRKDVTSLKDVKRFKEREIRALFVIIDDVIKNMKIISQEEKRTLELKITDLELRIKKLEEVK